MPIVTDGPLMESDNKGIDEFHVGYGATMRASAAQAWEDSPINQLLGINEMDRASGKPQPDYGELATGMPTPSNGPAISEAVEPAAANIDIIDANDRVRKAGLAPHLKLPDQPDIPPAQLAIMMERARRRAELDATIDRGPQGFIQSALDTGTSFAVGAVDPLNLASAFIPVFGELRYGKILASAGDSLASRLAVRAGTGAAEGVVGQAALEPLDWWSHTQDGRDFGMADVLHNLMFGAALGGGLHAGGGFISDAYRGARGRVLYPFGPGEPLAAPEGVVEPATGVAPSPSPARDVTAVTDHIDQILAESSAPPSPAVLIINDLPHRAHEDAMRGAIANLIDGEPVKAGEMLDAAAQTDPRIRESFDAARASPRETIFDDIHDKLLGAGLDEDAAGYNAAIVAARYATRAERLGLSEQGALDLYRQENISVGRGEMAAEGRTFLQSLPTAPTFYSAVDRAVTSSKQEKASPEQWLGTLKNVAGVKPEEMHWLGLEDWLREQKGPVTRSQVQDFVRANQIEVKEVNKGGSPARFGPGDVDAAKQFIREQTGGRDPEEHYGYSDDLDYVRVANAMERDAAIEGRARELGEAENGPGSWDRIGGGGREHYYRDARRENVTKYGDYTLPGGVNYREMLLTLPERHLDRQPSERRAAQAINERLAEKYGSLTEAFQRWTEDEREEFDRLHGAASQAPGAENFSSSHYSSHWNEPNILAHVRFDDRVSDGKKTLHIAEVQSDWHQQGKREGYQGQVRNTADVDKAIDANLAELRRREPGLSDDATADDYQAAWDKHPDLDQRQTELYRERGSGAAAVPDAPFKTTWPELAMKRMIRYAAEQGYDRISWDTGATNAERYDLSKKIQAVRWNKETGDFQAKDHSGSVVLRRNATPEELDDIVGKDVAEKLRSSALPQPSLMGLDLKVGGEGMAGFYDKILPATVGRLVKKFGAKVEEGHVEKPPGIGQWKYEGPEMSAQELRRKARNATSSVANQLREIALDLEGGIPFAQAMERNGSYATAEMIGGELRGVSGEQKVHAVDITPELRKAAVEQGFPLFQKGEGENPRGRITLADNRAVIDLFEKSDASTFMHESSHLWLDELMRDAGHEGAPAQLRGDRDAVLSWLGVKDASEIKVEQHEKWAEGFEHYLASGEAPSSMLAKAFEQFKRWMVDIYRAIAGAGREINPEIKAVMDRLLATDQEISGRNSAGRNDAGGNRTAPQAQLGAQADKDAAWRQLAQRQPEFDDPDVIAASKAADALNPPPTRLDERVTAAEKADAFAKQMYDMFAHRLPEEDRVRLDDLIKRIEDDNEARETAIVRGGSCLFGVV